MLAFAAKIASLRCSIYSDGEEETEELQEEKLQVMTNLVVSDFFPVVAKHDFSQYGAIRSHDGQS
jgi:hypothetical protein